MARPHDSTVTNRETEERVLTEATLKAAEFWDIKPNTLGKIIGLSEVDIVSMAEGNLRIIRTNKSFELAQIFLRLYRSLDAITGGEDSVSQSWLTAPNTALGVVPLEHIQTIRGLIDTVSYVDSRRATL